jgi:hypothetical protein
MSLGDIKTFILKGNKTKQFLSCKFHPLSDFSVGRWNICISQLIYHIKSDIVIDEDIQTIKEVCGVSLNLVKGSQFNAANEVQTVFQNLNIFILQGKKNDKKQVNFDKTWSLINNFSDEIRLYINNLSDDSTIFDLLDCNFYISVLLQRIK